MIRHIPAILLFLTPATASALSCLPPDPMRLYKNAAKSETAYLPVYGHFDSGDIGGLTTKGNGGYDENAAPSEDYPGLRFIGTALTKKGFTYPFDRQVTLRLSCIGPWCTGKPAADPMMAFFEVSNGDYLLDINACGGMAFAGPTQADLDTVEACHLGGPCTPVQ